MSRPSTAVDAPAGDKIGKYEILSPLSTGGMAELYLGYTTGPGGFRKYVVIKQILPDVKQDEQFVQMFLEEARITAAFNHPNIAQVFDLGEDDGLYLAMEFIAGQNLNQITHAAMRREQSLPFGFSVAVAHDVCLALHYAHTFTEPTGRPAPVVHRDVAQKNVMVTYEGVTKLLDFGIAKQGGTQGKTQAGMVKGTTGYMSPEQVRGQAIDGRSDVFSVGVMLHEMLTGRRLFAGRTELEEMEMVIKAPIPRPATLQPLISEELSDVVMRSLARERADRFASAKEMARALAVISRTLPFDLDMRASFMRELFEEKMAATQALLEAAEGGDPAQAFRAARELRRDRGLVFPSSKSPAPSPPPVQPSQPLPSRASSELPSAPAPSQAEPQPLLPEEPRRGWLYALVVLTALVLAAAAVKFVDRKAAQAAQEPVNPTPSGPPKAFLDHNNPEQLPPLPEFGTQPPPPPPPVEDPEPLEEPEPTKAAVKALRHGTFTLVTSPDCEVFRGKERLGRTPLFNAKLPKGTHLLRLKGPHGEHLLSVPITPGKNAAFRVSLEDLPRASP